MELNELTIGEYAERLSSRISVPGGGSALALTLEIACSLGMMTGNFTIEKKGYEPFWQEAASICGQLKKIRKRAHELIVEDGDAYQELMAAFRTKDQEKIRACAFHACEIPAELYSLTKECERLCLRMSAIGNKNLTSDALIGSDLCRSIYPGCIANIKLNVSSLPEDQRKQFELSDEG